MAKGKDGYDCLKLAKKAKPVDPSLGPNSDPPAQIVTQTRKTEIVGDQTFGDEEVKGEPGDQTLGDEELQGKYFTVEKEGLKFLCPLEYSGKYAQVSGEGTQ